MVRTPAGLMSQIHAARYGASGLAVPQYAGGTTMPGVASQPGRMGTAWNPATMRAIARSATPQGYAMRQTLRHEQEQEQQAFHERFEGAKERLATEIGRLVDAGRIEEAIDMLARLNRLRGMAGGE